MITIIFSSLLIAVVVTLLFLVSGYFTAMESIGAQVTFKDFIENTYYGFTHGTLFRNIFLVSWLITFLVLFIIHKMP